MLGERGVGEFSPLGVGFPSVTTGSGVDFAGRIAWASSINFFTIFIIRDIFFTP